MKTKEDICLNCGGSGFKEAFVFCNKCQNYVVHRYCLPKFTFTGFVLWLCDDCEPRISHDDFEARISVSSSLKEIDCEASKSVQLKETLPTKLRRKRRNSGYSLRKSKGVRCKNSCSPHLKLHCFDNEVQDPELGRQKGIKNNDVAEAAESLESKNSGLVESGKNDRNCGRQTSLAESLMDERVVDNAEPLGLNFGNGKKQKKLAKQAVLNESNSPEDTESCQSKGWKMVVCNVEPHIREDEQEPKSVGETKLDRICSVEVTESWETLSHIPLSPNIVNQSPHFRALPIKDPIWRGNLGISSEHSSTSVGLAAHLSSIACSRVSKAAKSLPKLILPELFPSMAVWPKGFMKWGPSDDSIALYFFPDSERNEKVFDGLVNDMICKDWAMKTVTETAELLIFTSMVLPFEYWRFQSKFYLWGVFKGKKALASVANVFHTEVNGQKQGDDK